MSDIFYIWIATGILFLLVEMFTATFYGLAVSLSGFLTALYVLVSWDTSVDIPQGVIFVMTSVIFSYFLPKHLKSRKPEIRTGLDLYVGHSYPLERVGNDWKLKIEGVDYLISDESVTDDFLVGQKAEVVSHNAGVLTVFVKKRSI